MNISRRALLKATAASTVALSLGPSVRAAQPAVAQMIEPNDRVFICNEDSNTMSVIDPRTNTVDTTINFTSFAEIGFGFALGPGVIARALIFALVMGLIGGFLPAVRAARLNIVNALRAS